MCEMHLYFSATVSVTSPFLEELTFQVNDQFNIMKLRGSDVKVVFSTPSNIDDGKFNKVLN